MRERFVQSREPKGFGSWGVFATFLLLYCFTSAPAFLGGDSGLFAVVYADGGYAHAPGYPIYSAYLYAMSWLPATSPAHGASLATGLLGATAVAVLYAAARRWGLGRIASLFGAGTFGLARHVWVFHSQPEVFALNHLLAAAIFWAAAPRAPVRGLGRAALLGLLAGLGLSHHHPIVLMAPVGLWGVSMAIRESEYSISVTLSAGLGTLLAGLLPYSYLLAVEYWNIGWHWRDPTSVGDLVSIFLRRDYGTFQLLPGESTARDFRPVVFWAREVAADFSYVPALAAVVGGVAGGSGAAAGEVDRGRPSAGFTLCVVAALVASGPFFVSLLPRAPEGVNYLFLRRFHLFSELHVAFLAAVGAQFVFERWLRTSFAILSTAALFATAGVVGSQEVRVRHDPAVEKYIEHTFSPLAENAIVVGSGDHHFFGLEYLQRGLQRRTDIDYVGSNLYAADWYRARLERRFHRSLPTRLDESGAHELVEKLLATGRPVYATSEFHSGVFDRWTVAPYGTVMRLFPENHAQPPVRQIFRRNRQLYASFEVETDTNPPPHTWSRDMMEAYARHWETVATGLESLGESELGAQARALAERLAPWRETAASRQSEGGN